MSVPISEWAEQQQQLQQRRQQVQQQRRQQLQQQRQQLQQQRQQEQQQQQRRVVSQQAPQYLYEVPTQEGLEQYEFRSWEYRHHQLVGSTTEATRAVHIEERVDCGPHTACSIERDVRLGCASSVPQRADSQESRYSVASIAGGPLASEPQWRGAVNTSTSSSSSAAATGVLTGVPRSHSITRELPAVTGPTVLPSTTAVVSTAALQRTNGVIQPTTENPPVGPRPNSGITIISEKLKALRINNKIISRIDHSSKFRDNVFEYRFVVLPRNHPFLDIDPDDDIREGILSETEWRALGIRQTKGWEHFGFSKHESNILLFRRPINTDPRTGCVPVEIQMAVAQRRRNLARFQALLEYNHQFPYENPCQLDDDDLIGQPDVLEADDDDDDEVDDEHCGNYNHGDADGNDSVECSNNLFCDEGMDQQHSNARIDCDVEMVGGASHPRPDDRSSGSTSGCNFGSSDGRPANLPRDSLDNSLPLGMPQAASANSSTTTDPANCCNAVCRHRPYHCAGQESRTFIAVAQTCGLSPSVHPPPITIQSVPVFGSSYLSGSIDPSSPAVATIAVQRAPSGAFIPGGGGPVSSVKLATVVTARMLSVAVRAIGSQRIPSQSTTAYFDFPAAQSDAQQLPAAPPALGPRSSAAGNKDVESKEHRHRPKESTGRKPFQRRALTRQEFLLETDLIMSSIYFPLLLT